MIDKAKLQTATSASVRPAPAKPSVPWRQAELTSVPPEVLAEYGTTHVFAWRRMDDVRQDEKKDQGWQLVRRKPAQKASQGGDPNVDGSQVTSVYKRRDCLLMMLSRDRKAARDYDVWERSQAMARKASDPQVEELAARSRR